MAPRDTENMYRTTVKILKCDVVYNDISQLLIELTWQSFYSVLAHRVCPPPDQPRTGLCPRWGDTWHLWGLIKQYSLFCLSFKQCNPDLQQHRCSKYHSSSSQVLGTKLETLMGFRSEINHWEYSAWPKDIRDRFDQFDHFTSLLNDLKYSR